MRTHLIWVICLFLSYKPQDGWAEYYWFLPASTSDYVVITKDIYIDDSEGSYPSYNSPLYISGLNVGFSCRYLWTRPPSDQCSDIPLPGMSCDTEELEFNGIKLSLVWFNYVNGDQPISGPPPPGFDAGVGVKTEGIGVGVVGTTETVTMNCSMTLPVSDRILIYDPTAYENLNMGGRTRSFQLKLNLIFRSASVFVREGPSEITGPIGETASSQLILKVPNGFVGGLNLSWDINEGDVCKNWNPSLRLDSGGSSSPGIGVNHVSTLALSPGDNPLVATFVPTELGGFTCHGTLRVSID